MLIDSKTNIPFVDNLMIYEFHMDKIKDAWYNGDKEKAYLAILDFNEEELKMVGKGDKYMNEFKKKVKELNEDTEFKQFLTQEEDEKKRISTFEAIAREEGKVIGRQEGKSLGIEEANVKIAKKMLKENMDIQTISRLTDLTVTDIQNLKATKD